MNPETRTRVLSYRRAIWRDGVSAKLEDKIIHAHKKLPFQADRTFAYLDGSITCQNTNHKPGIGYFLHIVKFTSKQEVSAIDEPPRDSTAGKEHTHPPPEKQEFQEGSAYVLVSGNDLIVCSDRVTEYVARQYIRQIHDTCFKKTATDLIQIAPVANIDKVRTIVDEGVKSIKLASTAYKASYMRMKRKSEMISVGGEILKSFLSIFFPNDDIAAIEAAAHEANYSVAIEVNCRTRKNDPSPLIYEKAAEKLLNETEDGRFTIVTNKNTKITSEEIRITKAYPIKPYGSGLLCESAWQALIKYRELLVSTGRIAQ